MRTAFVVPSLDYAERAMLASTAASHFNYSLGEVEALRQLFPAGPARLSLDTTCRPASDPCGTCKRLNARHSRYLADLPTTTRYVATGFHAAMATETQGPWRI